MSRPELDNLEGAEVKFQQLRAAFIGRFEPLMADIRCILLGGSFAEGFDLNRSDLDVLLVAERAEPFGCKSGEYLVEILGGKRAEILVIDAAMFRSCLLEIERYSKTNAGHCADKFIQPQVLVGKREYSYLMSYFDFDRYKDNRRDRLYKRCINRFEDVVAAKDSMQWDLVVVWCRTLTEIVVEMLLNAHGDFYDREKWRLARVLRCFGAAATVYKDFRQTLLSAPTDNIHLEQTNWSEKVLKSCRDLQLHALFPPVSISPECGSLIRQTESYVNYRSDPWQFLAIHNGRLVVIQNSRIFDVDPISAVIFLCLHKDLNKRDLFREVFRHVRVFQDDTYASIDESIRKLQEWGIVTAYSCD